MYNEQHYIAQGKKTEQVSEDEWERHRPALNITGSTTVAEIFAWADSKTLDIRPGITLQKIDSIPQQ